MNDSTNFIDHVKIFLKAGKGGDGCLSFRREKFVPFGGPNGGNGGNGGSIFFIADSNITTLYELGRNPHIEGFEAEKGQPSNKHGSNAKDKYIYVPRGTIFKNEAGEILADLTNHGDTFLGARGGRGGRGNMSFKTHKHTAPKIAEYGEDGQKITLLLELKLLADVGLAGFPNAGKSTLLSRVSGATPKIADYPFTTLSPNIGVVAHKNASFAMADIPGLIEGASQGKGLGYDFLRHLERTRVIIQMVDPAGFGKFDPVSSIKVIADELSSFNKKIAKKPRIIAVNKADLPEAEQAHKAIKRKYKTRKVFLISAATGEGVSELLDCVIETLNQNPIKEEAPKEKKIVVHSIEPAFKIEEDLETGYVRITGADIERMVQMTNLGQEEGVIRLKKYFKLIGLDKALAKRGIGEEETVIIGEKSFQWTHAKLSNISARVISRRRKKKQVL